MNKQYRGFIAKATPGPGRRATFTASTSSPDRHSDTIAASGWKLDNYLKNGVVCWSHQYDQPPIGRCVSISAGGNALTAEIEFAPADVNPFAETIYQMVRAGMVRAMSVGFIGLKWEHNDDGGIDYLEQELLELSIVSVPANPESLVQPGTIKSASGSGAIQRGKMSVQKNTSANGYFDKRLAPIVARAVERAIAGIEHHELSAIGAVHEILRALVAETGDDTAWDHCRSAVQALVGKHYATHRLGCGICQASDPDLTDNELKSFLAELDHQIAAHSQQLTN